MYQKIKLKIIQIIQSFNAKKHCKCSLVYNIRNDKLHGDLKIKFVSERVTQYTDKHDQLFQIYENPVILSMLVETPNMLRHLKRTNPQKLLSL